MTPAETNRAKLAENAARNRARTNLRCEECRYLICAGEPCHDGWCSVCAGFSSFIIPAAQSRKNHERFLAHQAAKAAQRMAAE